MFRAGKGARLLVALTAAMLALAGCGSDEDQASGDNTGPRDFKLWHYEGPTSAMGVAWNAAIEEFKRSHPNVTVKFEEKGFEQIQKTAQMVLNSNDAPDLMEYNKGNATAGLLSKQGLLTDMSEEVTKRGWDKLLSPSLQTTCKYDERGIMGDGKWFGVPNYAEYVLVFYNKDMFAQHGIQVPTSFDQFVAALDRFKQAGVTPLAVGGAEYPAHQIMYQLALTKADRGWVDRYQRYTGDVDFHDSAWSYGANTLAEWVQKGYIDKASTSSKAEDMGISFISGKAPIMISGTWWFGRLQTEIKNFQWGSFLWPSKMSAGSSGNIWVVPTGSKNKDLAYDFINITMQQQNQALLGNSGGVPIAADPNAVTDPATKTLISDFNTLSKQDGLAFYPDWPAPGYYDVLVSATQKLINGSASPDQVLDEIAKPYQENRANLGG
ncbi:MAG TPA: extracellular solute-binding protein [Actinophytocola sp.]|uniref:ABC transporter substrate-binding protein n=1 Tax=Actinophytocola sp. TaxID=1872138 RepID=UPI002DB77AE5|nr:extracellular solute-binding protein [Actinophytocola sp.]HEU5472256.1 extracellular solute-binding protein [Actinophytocola sp.]